MHDGLLKVLLPLLMSAQISACASRTTWKEEVLLHDGSKIVVERSMNVGILDGVMQSTSISDETLSFFLPGSGEKVFWKNEVTEDVGYANFDPLALHILNGIPYLVVNPRGCESFNKWGRPNPPYVFFKHNGKEWRRIAQADLPPEFKDVNLIIGTSDIARQKNIHSQSVISAETIKRLNGRATQDYFKSILRTEIPGLESGCGLLLPDGNGGWFGTGNFGKSHEECVRFCRQQKFKPSYYPCDSLFREKK